MKYFLSLAADFAIIFSINIAVWAMFPHVFSSFIAFMILALMVSTALTFAKFHLFGDRGSTYGF